MKTSKICLVGITALMLIVSCGNNGSKKHSQTNSQTSSIESTVKTYPALSPYSYLLYYYGYYSNIRFLDSYGYTDAGDYENTTGGKESVATKNCTYDRATRTYTPTGENYSAISFSVDNYTKSCSLWQYVKSLEERDEIFASLTKDKFEKTSYGNNMYHFENSELGIDCVLEENGWVFRCTVYGNEEYFFKKAFSYDDYKEQITNQLRFEKEYKGKRYRIKGKVTHIGEDAFDSRVIEYHFGEAFLFDVRVPASEAYYDIKLPAELTISGIVTSASSGSLNLKDVYFYSHTDKKYLGYPLPEHNTKTHMNVPKSYERQSTADGVTVEPKYASAGSDNLKVMKVTVTDEETILDMLSDAHISGSNSYAEWCCINPNAYIEANGQRYILTRAEGIEKAPGKTYYPKMTMSLDFKLHFPTIPKTTKSINFSEGEDSPWYISGIELNVPKQDKKPDYDFTGYLTNGSSKYNIEMKLYCVEGYEYEGYYRYLSQPADKKIPVTGEIGFETGSFANTESFYLFSGEGTERFDFDIEGNKASGSWKKYDSAADCENGGNNYAKRLELVMTKK